MRSVLLLVVLTIATTTSDRSSDISSASGDSPTLSPVTENPPLTYGNLTCEVFNATSICAKWLSGLTIVTNHSRSGQHKVAEDIGNIFQAFQSLRPSQQCLSRAIPLLCRYAFPTCDPAFSIPVYQPLCRWDCEILRDIYCSNEWQRMLNHEGLINLGVIDRFNCTKLSQPNAGNAPMCISTQDGAPVPIFMKTKNCYNGKGQGYAGTINTTETGIPCQSWSQQTPHQYLMSHDQALQYPELTGTNSCRNPGGKGDKPWCFTTNRTVRWDSCSVPTCSPGPTCQRYTGTACRHVGTIALDYIYINTSIASQAEYETLIREEIIHLEKNNVSSQCQEAMIDSLCRMNFPLCDKSSSSPTHRPVCRNYCLKVNRECTKYLESRMAFKSVIDHTIIVPHNCTADSVPANGGDKPECDQLIPIQDRNFIRNGNFDCYDASTKGTGYNGIVNITENGIPCQPWDAPSLIHEPRLNVHIHPLSSLFRRYLEGHNYCRNPEGRGNRPWCYTLNSTVRWEYCDIPVCSTRPLVLIAGTTGGATIATIIIIIIMIAICCICCKIIRSKYRKNKLIIGSDGLIHLKEMKSISHVNPLYALNPKSTSMEFNALEYEASKLPRYPRDNLTYVCDLGQGHFGVVVRAVASGIISEQDKLTVAVKVLKEGSSLKTKEEFFREATFMNNFDHPNIVRLIGVCCEQEPYCMILEHMSEGDLNSLLCRNNPMKSLIKTQYGFTGFSVKQLVDMAIDIAAGLSYLSKNHYIHRDLATRNCLVGKDLKVKLADFGLSQEIYTDNYFRLKDSEMLPIRWMPPESIVYAKFSAQGDVWSFGVVLWEIFSFGAQPYFGKSNEEVVQYVRDGYLLEQPGNCPQEIYDLMVDCWAMDPNERPTSEELYVGLRRWTPEMSATLHVQANQPHYQNMSTILEYARRSLDGSATTRQLETTTNGDTTPRYSSQPTRQSYDHLQPTMADNEQTDNFVLPLPVINES